MKSNKQKNSIGFVDEAELAHLELLEKKKRNIMKMKGEWQSF